MFFSPHQCLLIHFILLPYHRKTGQEKKLIRIFDVVVCLKKIINGQRLLPGAGLLP